MSVTPSASLISLVFVYLTSQCLLKMYEYVGLCKLSVSMGVIAFSVFFTASLLTSFSFPINEKEKSKNWSISRGLGQLSSLHFSGDQATGDVDIFTGSIYSSDDFRMFAYKIKRCPITKSHDWTRCPYAHRGEKAQRRDPRKFNYSAISCLDYRNGKCDKGESCELAHGVFEYWLHPEKYRTRPCNAGRYCKRKVCFFAHSPEELRSETKYKCRFVYPPIGEGKYDEAEMISASSSLPRRTDGLKENYLKRLDDLGMKERNSGYEETEMENININWIYELLK